jgi:hypothetical protein
MKLYKSPDNKVYAYEADGSQDHLILENFLAITQEEADVIIKAERDLFEQKLLASQPTKEQQIAELQKQIDALKA